MSEITRRDFVNGTLMVAGSSMLPFDAASQAAMAPLEKEFRQLRPGGTVLRIEFGY